MLFNRYPEALQSELRFLILVQNIDSGYTLEPPQRLVHCEPDFGYTLEPPQRLVNFRAKIQKKKKRKKEKSFRLNSSFYSMGKFS